MRFVKVAEQSVLERSLRSLNKKLGGITPAFFGCVAQLVEQRSPKSPVGGSSPSALERVMKKELNNGPQGRQNVIDSRRKEKVVVF